MAMIMTMFVLMPMAKLLALLPVNFSRQIFFAVSVNVHLGSGNSAAIYSRDLQPCSDVKRRHRFFQQFYRHTGVHECAQEHVATHPGKTFKVSDTHNSKSRRTARDTLSPSSCLLRLKLKAAFSHHIKAKTF